MWHGYCAWEAGLSISESAGLSSTQRLQIMVWKRENALLWSEENGQIASSWKEGKSKSNNHLCKEIYSEMLFCISFKYKKNLEKYWKQTHVIIKLEGNRGCNLHRITKIGQQNIRKRLLVRLVSLDFCCNIEMLGLKFDVKKRKIWKLYHALYQWFGLTMI